MKNNKEQRELLKEIVGRLKEKEAEAKKKAAESDSLIAWGRQTMIEEVLLMLYQMHDEMVDDFLVDLDPAEADKMSLPDLLAQPISILKKVLNSREFNVLHAGDFNIIADIYGYGNPLLHLRGCGLGTHANIITTLESLGLPNPDRGTILDPTQYGFHIIKKNDYGRMWYKKIEEE